MLVTRGDVDIAESVRSLQGFDELIVWNNAEKDADERVYGRYLAAYQARNDVIVTHDDDCVVPDLHNLVKRWRGGLLVNVPGGEKPWLAWGGVFDRRDALAAFGRYLQRYPADDDLLDWADVIFATQTAWTRTCYGHRDLPWATAPTRMYRQPDHYTGQERVRQRCVRLDPTRFVQPYVGDRPARISPLAQTDVGDDVEAYWRLLDRLWRAGDPFAIIEHDIVIDLAALAALRECPNLWCSYPYPLKTNGREQFWHGLGCVRFRGPLLQAHPELLAEAGEIASNGHPPRHWCGLDQHIAQLLGDHGYERCEHGPPVQHLNTALSHGCG